MVNSVDNFSETGKFKILSILVCDPLFYLTLDRTMF